MWIYSGTESHPAVLLALGMLPGDKHGIDKAIMNRTLDEVLKSWNLPAAWGWDFGLMACVYHCHALPAPHCHIRFHLARSSKNGGLQLTHC